MPEFTEEQRLDEIERRFRAGEISEENIERAEQILVREGRIGQRLIPGSETRLPRGAEQPIIGFNEGLAEALGVPVDVVNFALEKVGLPVSDRPFAGSESIKEGFRDLEILPDEGAIPPTSGGQRVLRRAGQEVGRSAPVVGGLGTAARLSGQQALTRTGASGSTLQNVGRGVVQPAVQAPGTVAAGEAGLATTAGVGAGVGREVAGENGELIGQLAGAFGPVVATGGIRQLIRGNPRTISRNVDDFADVGADLTVGTASGTRRAAAAQQVISRSPLGGRIVRIADETKQKIGKRLAQRFSGEASPEVAGRAIQKGIDDFSIRFGDQADDLFGRLRRFVDPDTPVSVTNTQRTLAELADPVSGAPNISRSVSNDRILRIKNAMADDVADGSLSFRSLQGFRSAVGRMLSSSEVIADAPRAQLKRLYGALSDDLLEAAREQGGQEAVKAFRRANKFYKAGLKRVEDFLQPLARKEAPEKVFRAVELGGKQGASQIRAVKQSLKPEQWKVVQRTVARRLGLATPGNQDELGEVFSTETFLTNFNRLSSEAKNALFTGEMRTNLNKLARVSSQIRESSRVLGNPSGTAPLAANISAGTGTAVSAATGNLDLAAAFIAWGGGNNLASRLMTNQRFVRWLAKSTEIPPSQIPNHVNRLGQIQFRDATAEAAALDFLDALGSSEQEPSNQEAGGE